MATKSALKNVVISSNEKCENLINALEKSKEFDENDIHTISVFELCPSLNDNDLIASENKVHISDVIIMARRHMKLNKRQFAKIFNVSPYMISKWESGHYNFSIETLALIAFKLGLSLDIKLKKQIT